MSATITKPKREEGIHFGGNIEMQLSMKCKRGFNGADQKSGMKMQRQRNMKIHNMGVDSKRKSRENCSTWYTLEGKTKMERKRRKNKSKREGFRTDWQTNYKGFREDYDWI